MAIKISVGMPVYNGERYLPQAIESILAQTCGDFEFIISDNASTDNTEAICREYGVKDKRIRYYRNAENIGASDNYNAVFRYAAGTYFKWTSCNDFCKPTLLARCADVLERHSDVVLCYPKTVLFDDTAGILEHYDDNLILMDEEPFTRFERLLTSMRLNNAMNGLIRAETLRKTHLIRVYLCSDVVMMAELALHGKFSEAPEYLYYRRMDKDTATRMKAPEQVLEHYHPKRDRRMLLQHWKLIAGYGDAIRCSAVELPQKIKCYRYLLRQFIWARKDLLDDLVEVARVTTCGTQTIKGR